MDKIKLLIFRIRFKISIFFLRRTFKNHGVPKIYARSKKDKDKEKFMNEYLNYISKNG